MNKKMREILKKIEEKQVIANEYLETKELDKANSVISEIEDLQK